MKTFNFKKIAAMALAVMTLISATACSGEDAQENEDQQQENNTIVFGTSADYAPFEFHTQINGEDTIVGFDVELAKMIAEDMGKELEIKDISFDLLLNELQNGTIDFVIAAMAATDERLEQADASDSYYTEDYQRVVFRAEDADKYTDFDCFEGAKVAVQSGSIQVGMAEENLLGCELLILQSAADMFNNLLNGKCDAVLVDGNVADGYVAGNEGLALLDKDFPSTEGSCVWVRKDDPKGILDSINATIDKAQETEGLMAGWMADAEELSGTEE